MKDIYELLNDIDIDETEFEEIEVDELEKARVKKALKKSIRQKKKRMGWKKNVAAAAILCGLSVTTIGLTFPAYAGSIPVIGDIFRFLDNGRTGLYDDYKEYSTEINMTDESNGIRVTLNDAIFDGKTISLTYSIESEQDLGDQPILEDFLEIKGVSSQSGSAHISKVDDHNYVGIVTATNLDRDQEDVAKIKWGIDRITLPDQQYKEIKGSWKFALALDATERKDFISEGSSELAGVKVNIGKISFTPMSFIVYYDQIISKEVRDKWHAVDVEIEIRDDLGNSYSGEGNGGSGDGYNMNWSKTFEKLDENASKLIITPQIMLREHTPDNFGSVEITKDGPKEIPIPEKPGKGKEEFVLEDIVIDINGLSTEE
ncbi:DUF4179 domain-containing protein [Cytobacillus solani]|uniref:Anti-sigma factor n=1 Tax=Cytobacillus solani TaxID=1637975 RepID=A0A0Q3SJN9_9BACI|nr:DUF4179 domain-containing protein [Cytobacillus solani]KOP82902.1 anti-sigma factor [Bacillus sp. FJAT-21945]KQL19924.1 anti-sigma factor [Cytobacillus solani]USK53168.1 DUF4179 domain-containing protein [Cytobacillus solani]